MRTEKGNTIKKIIEFICSTVKKHWVVSAIFLTGSGWWFSLVLAFLGEDIGLITIDANNKKNLTTIGYICTAFILILVILTTLIQKYNEQSNKALIKIQEELKESKAGYELLNIMLSQFGLLCNNKSNSQLKKYMK